jgi:hypothetical protein
MMKRANFANIQASHVTPCPNYEQSRLRTGYESVIAHRASDKYAVAAKEDGIVSSIDSKTNIVTLRYNSGKTDIVKFGPYEGDVGGIYLHQKLDPNVTIGEKIKQGDIVAYNPGFFSKDPASKQVNWNHGITANVALIVADDTIEDSSAITKPFSDRLTIAPTELRSVRLTSKSIIDKVVKVGDKVLLDDFLCVIEDADISDMVAGMNTNTIDLIAELNMKHPKAKHSGVISKIDVYYSCELENMTPSVSRLVSNINRSKIEQHKYAKQHGREDDYPLPTVVPMGTKFKGVEFDDDTILVLFYITADLPMDMGSKLVVCNQLKSVVANVLEYIPTTESGKEIDILFGPNSVAARIVMSPIINGRIEASLLDAEKQIVDMYFG